MLNNGYREGLSPGYSSYFCCFFFSSAKGDLRLYCAYGGTLRQTLQEDKCLAFAKSLPYALNSSHIKPLIIQSNNSKIYSAGLL